MAKVERLDDSGAQGQSANRLAIAKTGGPNQLATVSAITSGLRVSYWNITSAGDVSLGSSRTFHHVTSQFDATRVATPVVVAYRDSGSHVLRVVSFNDGHVPGAIGGTIDDRRLAIVRESFQTSWFVAYSKDDELRVQYWKLTGSGPNPVPDLVDSSGDQAGTASHIAGTWSGSALVTAVRTGGSLKLIRWAFQQGAVKRLGDSGSQGGPVSELAATGFSALDQRAARFVVTAAKNGSGNLELNSWQPKSNGDLELLDTASAGAIGEVAITSFDSPVAENLGVCVTAVRNGSGKLELISWQLHDDGSIHRLASASAGTATHIAIGPLRSDIVATTCVDSNGNEKVITWRIAQDALFPP